jgi:type I restriction enzyme S subunit
MEEVMEKLDLKNIDKSKWNYYRFDQIASKISETVDPNSTDLDIYIGLEHLDSESIHVTRRGSPADVSGGKLKCFPGDIIFGKRRAYQRKAAIVDFEGICSAHAFVLRAIPEVMDPKLFPFFLHSDLFMHCAVDISVGGLSPTINWGQLKEQEFLLPPTTQQAEIAELLWAMDEVIQKNVYVIKRLFESKSSIQRMHFDRRDEGFVAIDDCAQVYSGGTPNRKKAEFWGGEIPWAKTAEVNYERILTTEECITELGLNCSAAKLVPENSILLAMYGQGVTRGRVALTGIPLSCNQACAVIQPNAKYQPEYVYSYLEYKYEELRSLAHGANQQNLNLGMIKSFLLPKADLDAQVSVVQNLQAVDGCLREVRSNVESAKSLQKSLINQVF